MSKCHNNHFANLLPFPIAGRGGDQFRSQRNPRSLQPCTTCPRMVSQGNQQIQEELRRHPLSVSEGCNVVINLIRLEGVDRTLSPFSAVARGGAGGVRAPPSFFPKK